MMNLLHPAAYVCCADQIPQRSHIDEAQRWDPTGKTLFRYLVFARRRGGVCLVLWCGGCQGDSSFSDIQQEMWGSLCEGIIPQKCLKIKVEKGKKIKDTRNWSGRRGGKALVWLVPGDESRKNLKMFVVSPKVVFTPQYLGKCEGGVWGGELAPLCSLATNLLQRGKECKS